MEITYFENPEQKLMYKRVSPTEVYLVQALGRDLSKPFNHRHEKITYPTSDRLDKVIADLKISTAQDWEMYLMEFMQVNKEKLAIMSAHRQQLHEKGALVL